MDELLQKALQRREALRSELAAVETFINAYSTIVARGPRTADQNESDDLFAPVKVTRAQRAQAVSAMMDDAERLILEAGRPLPRSELLSQIETAGHTVEGRDKSKVLGTNLWRSRRFHNIHGAGYWPKSTPIPTRFRSLEIRDSMLS